MTDQAQVPQPPPTLFEAYLGIWEPLYTAATFSFKVLWDGIRNFDLGVVKRAQDIGFAQWYVRFGGEFAKSEEDSDLPALVASCSGVVIELGPGTGNQLPRFTASAITHVYGVEPNEAFAVPLHAALLACPQLERKYTALFCGIEDRAELARHGLVAGSVDCVLSSQVLCSVARPEEVVRYLYTLLKPGGRLVIREHGRNESRLMWWAQWFWSPFWAAVVGNCRLDMPIKEILLRAGEWEKVELKEDKDALLIMPRVAGTLTKPNVTARKN